MRLGNELRSARLAIGLTQQDVAKLLGCTQGKINKIESGAVAVKTHDLDMMLDAYRVGHGLASLMRELAISAEARSHWSGYRSAVPQWFRAFTDLEPAASEILSWHGERIPGALQSEHYMLTQFTEARAGDVTALVRNRLERKRVFDLKPPPSYRFILGAGTFRRMPGGNNPGVGLDQAQHLVELADSYPKVSIHVLPFDAKLPYVPNDFTIMRFTDGTKDCVFVEHVAGCVKLDDEDDFDQFVEAWDQLRGSAMQKKASVEYLRDLAGNFRAELVV
jgi:transcriptional regulator with XRE-family HTH domain